MAITWSGDGWVALTPYAVGARVVNVGNVYLCTVAGTSGNTGGPTATTTTPITDGSVTWSYLGAFLGMFVLGAAPELATGAPVITAFMQIMFLDLAEELVSDPAIWLTPTLLDAGRAYLAAHFGELARLRGHGPLTAQTVGPLSRSYASMIGPFAVDLTSAGRAYMDLVRTTPAALGIVA